LPTLQHGIAKVNPLYKPLELAPEVLALSEGDFKKVVAGIEPEIIILESERWRIISFDELKLKLSTHDDGGAGTTRNCEKVLQFKGSKGEVYSAKSSYSLSGLGGSLATFEAIPAFFSFASSGVDPVWMQGAPTTTIGGVPHTANFNCNEKGSVSPEMLMHPLKFVDQVRAAKGQPDVWVMVLLEGVQTHVTAPMLEFFAVNKIICGLRPPRRTSCKTRTWWPFGSSATTRTRATTK
jgi:hypothetical protein